MGGARLPLAEMTVMSDLNPRLALAAALDIDVICVLFSFCCRLDHYSRRGTGEVQKMRGVTPAFRETAYTHG
jgi:hypothetical protein